MRRAVSRALAERADPSLVAELRDRCVFAASMGGDPDACTACVAVAEAHVPTCDVANGLGESKCSTLGIESTLAPPSSLPGWWFDQDTRRALTHDSSDCGVPVHLLAFHYCTGTSTDATSPGTLSGFSGVGPVNSLPQVEGCEHRATSQIERISVMVGAHPETATIASYEDLVTFGVGPHCEPLVFSERDSAVVDASVVAPLKVFDIAPDGVEALIARREGLRVPFCGLTQRFSMFNKSCAEVLPALDLSLLIADTPEGMYNPVTGFEWQNESLQGHPDEKRCSIREPQPHEFFGRCPGSTGICGTGGMCVGGRYLNRVAAFAELPSVTYFSHP